MGEKKDEHLSKTIDDPCLIVFNENLTRDKEGGYRLKMNLPVLHKHYDDILAAIESSSPYAGGKRCSSGGKSKHIVDGDELLIKELFPNATIETIQNAGHCACRCRMNYCWGW
ncbi:MAG: hypothetical protein R2825_00690 [Saprospiraceae bacterium]